MLRLSDWTGKCETTALARQLGGTAHHAQQSSKLQTCRQSLDQFRLIHICCGYLPWLPICTACEAPSAQMYCLLLCCRLAGPTTADVPTSHVLQACSARVCLLNPSGLLLSSPLGTGLQAFTWLDMRQRACIRVSYGLLLTGLCAAKQVGNGWASSIPFDPPGLWLIAPCHAVLQACAP